MDLYSSFTTQFIEKALDGHALRQKAIASNLANADTPDYHRQVVKFEGSLQNALQKHSRQHQPGRASGEEDLELNATHHKHTGFYSSEQFLAEIQPTVDIQDESIRNDGNGVDMEREVVSMTKNAGKFSALSNIEGRLMRATKSVIKDAGG